MSGSRKHGLTPKEKAVTIRAPDDLREPYHFLSERSRDPEQGQKRRTIFNPYKRLKGEFGAEDGKRFFSELCRYGLLEIVKDMRGALALEETVEFISESRADVKPKDPDQSLLAMPIIPPKKNEIKTVSPIETTPAVATPTVATKTIPAIAVIQEATVSPIETTPAVALAVATPVVAVVQETENVGSMPAVKFQLTERVMRAFCTLWKKAVELPDGRGAIADPVRVLSSPPLYEGIAFLRNELGSVVSVLSRQESEKMADDLGLKLRTSETRIAILVPREQVELAQKVVQHF